MAGYSAIWKRFKSWAEKNGLEYFHELLAEHAEKYSEDLWTSKISPSTFNAHIKFLTGVFALLENQAGLGENVWRRITRKDKTPDQGRRNLSEDELRNVLERAVGNQRGMFAIGLVNGVP